MADAGKAMMLYKGVYDSTIEYEILDVVNYNGSLYISKINNNLDYEPTLDETKWQLFLEGGTSENIKVTDTQGIVGDAGSSSFVQTLLDGIAEKVVNIISGNEVVKKATQAETATKATQDGNGNNIVNTYVNKSKILDTAELISANTTSGNVAGALGVKAIVNNLSDNIDDALEDKLDKYIPLTNTSVNDVWETGIYKSSSWLDSPFASMDNQGTLIVIYYVGGASSNWSLQIFISPHFDKIMVRNQTGSGVHSEWRQIAYTNDISSRLNWMQLASFDSDTTLTVSNMSERSEISIAYGLLYDISVTLTLPMSVFRSNDGVIKVGEANVYYVSDTSIKITGLPTNYRLRIFSR